MNLEKLFNNIKNPLDDETVAKLLGIYASDNDFYSELVKGNLQGKTINLVKTVDRDMFYATLFNKWKSAILDTSKERYLELLNKGTYKENFVKMRNYLKTVPDVKTSLEASNIVNKEYSDKDLENAFHDYSWNSFGAYSGWEHVCSRYVTARKDSYPNIEHRLYLNIDSTDIYGFMNEFISECDEQGLIYYFKFSEGANRDDSIVIYSSTEDLVKYYNITNSIIKKLNIKLHKPPMLSGIIEDNIGYGSEPYNVNGKNEPFNSSRAKVIQDALNYQMQIWINNNIYTNVDYKGSSYPLYKYVAIMLTNKLYKRCLNRDENLKGNFDEIARIKNEIYNSIVREVLPNILAMGKSSVVSDIPVKLSDGRVHYIYPGDFSSVIKEKYVEAVLSDPREIGNIKNSIMKSASNAGIYADKFCFDSHALNRMIQVSREQKEIENQSGGSSRN
jgi:hypothetical protein